MPDFIDYRTPAEHICCECLEDDCDCGGNAYACNMCSECQAMYDEDEF